MPSLSCSRRHVDAMAIPGALTGALNYYRAAFGQGLWPAPPVVRIPVKVIWGEQDFSMEKDIATPPAELVPNAQVAFVKEVRDAPGKELGAKATCGRSRSRSFFWGKVFGSMKRPIIRMAFCKGFGDCQAPQA